MKTTRKKLRVESLESRQMLATLNPGIAIRDVQVHENAGYADVQVDLSDRGWLDVKIPYSTRDKSHWRRDYRAQVIEFT
jgi:hypothetical protein